MPVISHLGLHRVLAAEATNSTIVNDDRSAFSELVPAIGQCFIIMLGGYIAGRAKVISPTEAKGLNMFVSYVSLPALIFLSLATLDFSNVNWMFLISIFIAKSCIFFFVAAVTSIVNWGQNFGKAGLYAIFCTQSNDFALGYPIIVALYSKTYPEYATYLYLVAPVSLCILNPIGFVLMEIDKEKSSMLPSGIDGDNSASKQIFDSRKGSVSFRVAMGVARNPIVIMTVLGVIANFIFDKALPDFIYIVLKVIGSAYSATALFLLGLNMVGKVQTMKNGSSLLLPCLLIVIKIIALPLVTKEVISLLAVSSIFSDMGSIGNITEYGFLYGTFPTAPSVFVFASAYGIAVDIIASAMVACTFLSAPLMLISAKMITLEVSNPKSYYQELASLVFYLSIASAICSIWVLMTMYLSRKYRRVPHIFTILLVCGQLMACVGIWVDYFFHPRENNAGAIYANFLMVMIGIYSTKFMAVVVAISSALLQIKSLCFVLKMRRYAPVICFSVPATIFALYCVIRPLKYKPLKYHDQVTFMITKSLAVIGVVIDLLCLLVTLAATVFSQYFSYKMELYQQLSVEDKEDLVPEKERMERLQKSLTKVESVVSFKLDDDSQKETVGKSNSYKSRRDEILCENFGICRRNSYKDQLLVTGCETKRKVPFQIENLGFQFSLRGLGLPVGADRYAKPVVFDEENEKNNASPVAPIHGNPENCLTRERSSPRPKEKCQKLIKNYQAVVMSAGDAQPDCEGSLFQPSDEHEYTPHLVLVIYVCITMLADVSTGSCILLLDKPNGVYIELEFLNSILSYSLGIILFFLFGIDSKLIMRPVNNLWRRIFKKQEDIVLPEENDDLTNHICEQFRTYHLKKCVHDIVKDIRWRLRLYKSVFWGKDLVTWLIKVGLAQDRAEGVKYGRALLNGRIIKQFDQKFHFQDALYFYIFVSNNSEYGSSIGNVNISTSEDEITPNTD